MRRCSRRLSLVLSAFLVGVAPTLTFAEITGTEGIGINFSGRNSFQGTLQRFGSVYVDGTLEVRQADGTVIATRQVSSREPGGFSEPHPVTGKKAHLGSGLFEQIFIDGLPADEELTLVFTGQQAPFLHNGELHDPRDFEFSTSGTLTSAITGDLVGMEGGMNVVWEGGEYLLPDERFDIFEGATLTIRNAIVKSAEPDSSLTRGDILLVGGNLIAEDTYFENLSDIRMSRQDDDSLPRFQLTDCTFKSDTFTTEINTDEYVIDWNGLVEDHSSLYEVQIVTEAEPLPGTGDGLVLLQLTGDLSTLDSTALHIRIFDMAGRMIADKEEAALSLNPRFFKGNVRTLVRNGEHENLDDQTRRSLAESAFGFTETPDSEGVEITVFDPPQDLDFNEAMIQNCRLPLTDLELRIGADSSATVQDNLVRKILLGQFQDFPGQAGSSSPATDVDVIGNEVGGIVLYGSRLSIRENFVRSEAFAETGVVQSGTGILIGPNDTSDDLLATQSNEIKGNRVTGFSHGMFLRFAASNAIRDNTVEFNHRNLVFHGHAAGGQDLPLENNEIINNIFRDPQEFNGEPGVNFLAEGHCADSFCDNTFAIPSGEGPNIVGGAALAGNFWSDYTGQDANGDDIGDTPHTLGQPSNGSAYLDTQPLILVADTEIVVNDSGDGSDTDPNDEIIDADATKPGAQVTLRAAVEAANAREGLDRITFEADINVIEIEGETIEVTDAVEIVGSGNLANGLLPELRRNNNGPAMRFNGAGSGSTLRKLEVTNIGFGAVSDPNREAALERQTITLDGARDVTIDECRFTSESFSLSILLFVSNGGSATVTNCVFSGDAFAGVLVDDSPGSNFGRAGAASEGNSFVDVPVIIQGTASTENRVLNCRFTRGTNENENAGLEIFGAPLTITSNNAFLNAATLRVLESTARGSVIEASTFETNEDDAGGIRIDGAVETEISLGNIFKQLSPAIHLTGDAQSTVVSGNEFNADESNDAIVDVIGVLIESGDGTHVGPTEGIEGNVFTNHTVGVAIQSGQRNQVRGNRFAGENLKLMVDLAFDPNRPGHRNENDDDSAPAANDAPNRLQNYPDIHLTTESEVLASLDSRPGQTYGIDFYDGSDNPPLQHDINAFGARTAFTIPIDSTAGGIIMTATDADGNTSEDSRPLAVYIVDSPTDEFDQDAGDGVNVSAGGNKTLRAAIEDANGSEIPADTQVRILFSIPGPNNNFATTPVISVERALPELAFHAQIGGTFPTELINLFTGIGVSQDLFLTNTGLVEINGLTIPVGTEAVGLSSKADLSLERVKVTEFPDTGVHMSGEGKLTLRGCEITSNRGGIVLNPLNRAEIGGETATPGDFPGNIIARNFRTDNDKTGGDAGAGIAIDGTTDFRIEGNLIGLSKAGDTNPNENGIYIRQALATSDSAVIHANIISGNFNDGIHLDGCANIRITGNLIGINNGGAALGNGSLNLETGIDEGNGIFIVGTDDDASAGIQIGGDQAGDGNTISANRRHGIHLSGEHVRQTLIQGNIIGDPVLANLLDPFHRPGGTTAFANGSFGISLTSSPDNTVGGDTPGTANRIAGNQQGGIVLEGIDTGETTPIGTPIIKPITGNRILGNTIAYHADRGPGVQVIHGKGNVLSRNIMFKNGVPAGAANDGVQINVSQEAGDTVAVFTRGDFIRQAILTDEDTLTLVFAAEEIQRAREVDAKLEVFTRQIDRGFATEGWSHFLGIIDLTLQDGVVFNEFNDLSYNLDVSGRLPSTPPFLDLLISVTGTTEELGTSKELMVTADFEDSDDDGTPNRNEAAAVGDGDLNNNGVPDAADPAVLGIPVFDADGVPNQVLPVFVEAVNAPAEESVDIVELKAMRVEEAGVPLPDEIDAEAGLISLELELQAIGGTVRVRIGLPEDSNINAVYKLLRRTPEGPLEFALFDDANVETGVAEIILTDGELGDLDLLANARIQDPIALVFDPALPPVDHSSGGGDADTDGDGLPDSYEQRFFGSATAANPNTDTDGDGTTEAEEFAFGTSPVDASDVLRLTIAQVGKTPVITFRSKAGRTYQLESSADLQSFTDVGNARTGTGTVVTIDDFPDAVWSNRYFRLRVESGQ
ncbi:MAG: right-handed parallel beta-helix repeat-containing protein [Verrucomicrobiae bacterium]|nr:right-handed parallel beta-helix repeat-containing protein [Verrucomicrobiae bacterium]